MTDVRYEIWTSLSCPLSGPVCIANEIIHYVDNAMGLDDFAIHVDDAICEAINISALAIQKGRDEGSDRD